MMSSTPEATPKGKSSNEEIVSLIESHHEATTKLRTEKKEIKSIQGLPVTSIAYATTFFFAMIVMELALEAAGTKFPNLDGLAYGVTLFQFGFCFFLPIVVSRGTALRTLPRGVSECLPYVTLSLVVFLSTCFATMSLRYCSYPTKVVFKSGKLIPTMVVATFLNTGEGSGYGFLDYCAAGLLCLGAAGYSYNSGRVDTAGGENASVGIALLLISVFADAFTPNLQQRLMASPLPLPPLSSSSVPSDNSTLPTVEHAAQKRTPASLLSSILFPSGLGLSAPALMVNVNAVGFTGLLVFMAFHGTLRSVFLAARTEPSLLVYLTVVGAGLGTAVLAYTRLIRESGSVVAVAVATLRKVATVVLSYVVFPKAMSYVHVVSGLSVLAGILLSSYSKQRGSGGGGGK